MSEFADEMEHASELEGHFDKLSEEADALKKANAALIQERDTAHQDAQTAISFEEGLRDKVLALKAELEEQQAISLAYQKQIEAQGLLLQIAGRRMARLEKQLANSTIPGDSQKPPKP